MAYLPRFKLGRWQWLIALGISAMLFVIAGTNSMAASTPQQDVQRLNVSVEQAINKAEGKDFSAAANAYQQFDDDWFDVESGVKKASLQAYRDIEDAMGEVKFAFSIQPQNQSQVVEALKQLKATNQKFIAGGFKESEAATATSNTGKITIATLIERLNLAQTALDNNDVSTATAQIKGFQADWLEVEGVVATKSQEIYVAIENNMARVYGLLRSNPAKVTEAKVAIAQLQQKLQPYAGGALHYSLFDAALILLREGMEALLVLVALLAFLNKSGNGDKSSWLWIGAGLGILASIVTAVIIQQFFSNIASGTNRELLEGITGLFAAAMLFYVSYWLHSKSSLGAWQSYIRENMSSALAKNSVFSLALLAFLAIFREGAETVLFYIGMAPSISTTDLLSGLGLGAVILVAIAALMLGFGLKMPMKPFFLLTSLLIYYLGFKFVGSGIHALQVAGILPSDTADFLPSWEVLGLYPTWETTLPQLLILVVAVAVVLRSRYLATHSLPNN